MTALPEGAAAPPPTFDALPLSPEVRRALDVMGYKHPTPVQLAVYEPASRGASLVVQARTGTGKTAAFGLPLVVLFGPSDPVTWAPWRTEAHLLTGLDRVSVDDVLSAARVRV